jgi:DNA (cytosine-5)-methyltransferase 1
MQLNYIDLFAGTSALSEGFRLSGFCPVAHIEMDADACRTIKTRIAYHYLKNNSSIGSYYDYISGKKHEEFYRCCSANTYNEIVINEEISNTSLKNIFQQIDVALKKQKRREIDFIVGGPPCQAYSLIGRHKIDFDNDKRLNLYLQYGKFLKEFRPKIFVFENVPGLLNVKSGKFFENLKIYFKTIGYEIDYKILNAGDFGVLQNRKRVIIIGWQNKLKFSFPDLQIVSHSYTTEEIFSNLSPLKPGQAELAAKYVNRSTSWLEKFNLKNEAGFYTQHISRPHNQNDLKIYRFVIEKWNKENKRIKYIDIPEQLRTHKNTEAFSDRFKVVDGNGISHTIVAHIAKDGHYYIHPDINQCRSISVREAARIQSFPDDYFFEGSRTAAFRQIGNAIPLLLSLAIAEGIKKQLDRMSNYQMNKE